MPSRVLYSKHPVLRANVEAAVAEAAAALVDTLRGYPRYLDELAVEQVWNSHLVSCSSSEFVSDDVPGTSSLWSVEQNWLTISLDLIVDTFLVPSQYLPSTFPVWHRTG